MSGVVQFQKAGRRLRAQAAPNPLVTEIIDALNYLGGQAHRDMVVNCIAAVRRNLGEHPPEELAEDIVAAFHEHLRGSEACMLALPFGPESRRWGLSQEGAAMLRHKIRII